MFPTPAAAVAAADLLAVDALRLRSAMIPATIAQSPAGGPPQPSVYDEPVPARQPAYVLAVHAHLARQEFSHERR
jgi:hypothetical protein